MIDLDELLSSVVKETRFRRVKLILYIAQSDFFSRVKNRSNFLKEVRRHRGVLETSKQVRFGDQVAPAMKLDLQWFPKLRGCLEPQEAG